MSKINVTLRIDENLKKEADILFSALGMNLSTAVNVFLTRAVDEQRIPFTVGRSQPNAETLEAIDQARRGETIGSFSSISELMEALNA